MAEVCCGIFGSVGPPSATYCIPNPKPLGEPHSSLESQWDQTALALLPPECLLTTHSHLPILGYGSAAWDLIPDLAENSATEKVKKSLVKHMQIH